MARIVRPIISSLEWDVQTEKLFNSKGYGLKEYKMLTRSDSGALLNVCKKSYTPTTNEKFKDTVADLIGITKLDFHGFTEMGGGKKVLAYLKSEKRKIAGFEFDNYMVIGNSHDYSTGFFIASAQEMLRCENQFSKLHKGNMFSITHTANVENKIDNLVMKFEAFSEEQRKIERKMEIWKQIDIDQNLREMMLERILNIELGNEESKITTRMQHKINDLNYSFKRETNDIGDNLLGLFHGVTHYTTHVMNQKETVFGNIFGSKAEINNKAYDFCEMVVEGHIENFDLRMN